MDISIICQQTSGQMLSKHFHFSFLGSGDCKKFVMLKFSEMFWAMLLIPLDGIWMFTYVLWLWCFGYYWSLSRSSRFHWSLILKYFNFIVQSFAECQIKFFLCLYFERWFWWFLKRFWNFTSCLWFWCLRYAWAIT